MEEKIKEIIGDLIGDIDYSYAAFISPQAAEDYIVIPKKDGWHDGCPLDRENCYDCEFLAKGGTLGGKVWIDCAYDEPEESSDDSTVD